MNVLLLTSHAIAEHDDLDMFTRMGLPVYSIGGAYDPIPFEGKRPPVRGTVRYPDLEAATDDQRARLSAERGDPRERIDWAKACLAPAVVDWADTVVVHHFPEQWIGGNWDALEGKRVIWRTCGQSDPRLEVAMSRYRAEGLQVVRYSPKEREAFGRWGAFAGEDAMIRFGKDPADWAAWHGTDAVVGNITQHMMQRGDACGYDFWRETTADLPARPAGPGSGEMAGGIGELDYEAMREYLRAIRVYLYTGTRPASYTLGLMEAMLTGVPVVAMGAAAFVPRELYEAPGLTLMAFDTPEQARRMVRDLLGDRDWAASVGHDQQHRAVDLFGLDHVMGQWADFLGVAS